MKQMCRDCKNNHSHDHNHSHGEGKNAGETESFFRFWKLEIFTALLFVAGIILRHTGVLAAIDGNIGFDIADFIVFLIAILPVGIPVVREMLESWRHGSVMNEFTLMVAASTGAFVIGEYPEAVAVLLFYCIGEKLEGKASDDVRSRIRKLLGRLPETATVINCGQCLLRNFLKTLCFSCVQANASLSTLPFSATLLQSSTHRP